VANSFATAATELNKTKTRPGLASLDGFFRAHRAPRNPPPHVIRRALVPSAVKRPRPGPDPSMSPLWDGFDRSDSEELPDCMGLVKWSSWRSFPLSHHRPEGVRLAGEPGARREKWI
jgi:hypothetical protein